MLPGEQALDDALSAEGYNDVDRDVFQQAFAQAFGMLGPGLEIRHTTLTTFAEIVAHGCVDDARMTRVGAGIPLARKLLQVELGLARDAFTQALAAGAKLTHEQIVSWATMILDAHRPPRLNS